jgi:hypothetical protein
MATEHGFLAEDFSVGVDNVRWLMEQVSTSSTTAKQGMLVNAGPGNVKLKFRHVLFQVCLLECSLHSLIIFLTTFGI